MFWFCFQNRFHFDKVHLNTKMVLVPDHAGFNEYINPIQRMNHYLIVYWIVNKKEVALIFYQGCFSIRFLLTSQAFFLQLSFVPLVIVGPPLMQHLKNGFQ